MRKNSVKKMVKKELKRLFKSMDFVSNNFLNKEGISEVNLQIYCNIYQQLGLAWEFLGMQCKHWDGYKKIKNGEKVCRICGKLKDASNFYYLIPEKGFKDIGKMLEFYCYGLGFGEAFRITNDDGSLRIVYIHISDNQFL